MSNSDMIVESMLDEIITLLELLIVLYGATLKSIVQDKTIREVLKEDIENFLGAMNNDS